MDVRNASDAVLRAVSAIFPRSVPGVECVTLTPDLLRQISALHLHAEVLSHTPTLLSHLALVVLLSQKLLPSLAIQAKPSS